MQKYIVIIDSEAVATVASLDHKELFGPHAIFVPTEGHTITVDLEYGPREFFLMADKYAATKGLAVIAYAEVDEYAGENECLVEDWVITTCLTGYPLAATEAYVEEEHPFMPTLLARPELFQVDIYTFARSGWNQYKPVDFAGAIQSGLIWKGGSENEQ